jgi:hypothetical protein
MLRNPLASRLHTEMKRYLIQMLVGLGAAALTVGLPYLAWVGAGAVIFCLIPGMLVAIILTGNVHAWPTWMAALGNFLFYFLVTHLVTVLWAKLRIKLR